MTVNEIRILRTLIVRTTSEFSEVSDDGTGIRNIAGAFATVCKQLNESKLPTVS